MIIYFMLTLLSLSAEKHFNLNYILLISDKLNYKGEYDYENDITRGI